MKLKLFNSMKKWKNWELDPIASNDYNMAHVFICKKCKHKIAIDRDINPDKIKCPNCKRINKIKETQ